MTLTRTSPALGGATSTSSTFMGSFAAHATAALHLNSTDRCNFGVVFGEEEEKRKTRPRDGQQNTLGVSVQAQSALVGGTWFHPVQRNRVKSERQTLLSVSRSDKIVAQLKTRGSTVVLHTFIRNTANSAPPPPNEPSRSIL